MQREVALQALWTSKARDAAPRGNSCARKNDHRILIHESPQVRYRNTSCGFRTRRHANRIVLVSRGKRVFRFLSLPLESTEVGFYKVV